MDLYVNNTTNNFGSNKLVLDLAYVGSFLHNNSGLFRFKNYQAIVNFIKAIAPDYRKINLDLFIEKCEYPEDTKVDEFNMFSAWEDIPSIYYTFYGSSASTGYCKTPGTRIIYRDKDNILNTGYTLGYGEKWTNPLIVANEGNTIVLENINYIQGTANNYGIFQSSSNCLPTYMNLEIINCNLLLNEFSSYKNGYTSSGDNKNSPISAFLTDTNTWTYFDKIECFNSKFCVDLVSGWIKPFIPTNSSFDIQNCQFDIYLQTDGETRFHQGMTFFSNLTAGSNMNSSDCYIFKNNTINAPSIDTLLSMYQAGYTNYVSLNFEVGGQNSNTGNDSLHYSEGGKELYIPMNTIGYELDWSCFSSVGSIINKLFIATTYTPYKLIKLPQITCEALADSQELTLKAAFREVECDHTIDFTGIFDTVYIKNYINAENMFYKCYTPISNLTINVLNSANFKNMFYDCNLDLYGEHINITTQNSDQTYTDIDYMFYANTASKNFNNIQLNISYIGTHENFISPNLVKINLATFGANIQAIEANALSNMIGVGDKTVEIFIPSTMMMQDGTLDETTLSALKLFVVETTNYDNCIITTDADYHYDRATKTYSGTMPSGWYKTFHSIDEASEERFQINGNSEQPVPEPITYNYTYIQKDIEFGVTLANVNIDAASLQAITPEGYTANKISPDSTSVYLASSSNIQSELQPLLEADLTKSPNLIMTKPISTICQSYTLQERNIILSYNYILTMLNNRIHTAVKIYPKEDPWSIFIIMSNIDYEKGVAPKFPIVPDPPVFIPDNGGGSGGSGGTGQGTDMGGGLREITIPNGTWSDNFDPETYKTNLTCSQLFTSLINIQNSYRILSAYLRDDVYTDIPGDENGDGEVDNDDPGNPNGPDGGNPFNPPGSYDPDSFEKYMLSISESWSAMGYVGTNLTQYNPLAMSRYFYSYMVAYKVVTVVDPDTGEETEEITDEVVEKYSITSYTNKPTNLLEAIDGLYDTHVANDQRSNREYFSDICWTLYECGYTTNQAIKLAIENIMLYWELAHKDILALYNYASCDIEDEFNLERTIPLPYEEEDDDNNDEDGDEDGNSGSGSLTFVSGYTYGDSYEIDNMPNAVWLRGAYDYIYYPFSKSSGIEWNSAMPAYCYVNGEYSAAWTLNHAVTTLVVSGGNYSYDVSNNTKLLDSPKKLGE